jgi:Lon protease-like protein
MIESYFQIPLFPLGSTLFPDGNLALQIFEVRYLTMIKKCHELSTPFGIVTLSEGSEIIKPNENIQFSSIGTLAWINKFEAIQPNLFKIHCRGGRRFRIISTDKLPYGLWQADVELLAEDREVVIPRELQEASIVLRKLMKAMDEQGVPQEQRPVQEPYKFFDCAWVANRWAELLPLTLGQKDHLLGVENPRLRLDLITEILEENKYFGLG